MLLQSVPWAVQNPLIPLMILFGAGLGVGLAASLLSGLGNVDLPAVDERDEPDVSDDVGTQRESEPLDD